MLKIIVVREFNQQCNISQNVGAPNVSVASVLSHIGY